jgi:Na+-driven multidrug efflux pump
LNVILTAGYKAFNRPLVPGQAVLIGMGVTSVALFFLLPRYGILGAAWASLLAYSTSCVFMLCMLSRSVAIKPQDLMYPTRDDWKYVARGLCMVVKQVGFVGPFSNKPG